MAMKRKRSSGRRTKRPYKRARRSYKKRGMKYRRARPRQALLSVKRTCWIGSFTPATAATSDFWSYQTPSLASAFAAPGGVALGGLSNLAEYTPMFEQYKINGIKLAFKPRFVNFNMDQQVPTAGVAFRDPPYVSVIMDPRNNVTPSGLYSAATINSFLENGNVKTRRADRAFSVYVRPQVQEQFGGGAVRYIKSPWTNSGDTTVAQRGYHLFFHNQNFGTTFNQYDVFVTYFLQWKGMK